MNIVKVKLKTEINDPFVGVDCIDTVVSHSGSDFPNLSNDQIQELLHDSRLIVDVLEIEDISVPNEEQVLLSFLDEKTSSMTRDSKIEYLSSLLADDGVDDDAKINISAYLSRIYTGGSDVGLEMKLESMIEEFEDE